MAPDVLAESADLPLPVAKSRPVAASGRVEETLPAAETFEGREDESGLDPGTPGFDRALLGEEALEVLEPADSAGRPDRVAAAEDPLPSRIDTAFEEDPGAVGTSRRTGGPAARFLVGLSLGEEDSADAPWIIDETLGEEEAADEVLVLARGAHRQDPELSDLHDEGFLADEVIPFVPMEEAFRGSDRGVVVHGRIIASRAAGPETGEARLR